MSATEEYWTQLRPYQETTPKGDGELNKKTYLLKNTGAQNFNIQNTVKRFQHLLKISGLFKHFIVSKATKDERFKKVLDILNEKELVQSSNGSIHKDARHRKSETEEDAELLKEEEDEDEEDENSQSMSSREFQFRESPAYVDGNLRPYQIQGLNWLVSLHKSGLAGILADEMGLGKTLQTISFLGYLRYIEKVRGPFLVIAPKSTLNNWLREINKWTPEVNAFILQGDKDERAKLVSNTLMECKFDIVVASYEIIIREKAAFRKFDWQYIVIDEAHRIKNEESMLSHVLREFTSRNRLLITGTPLQNNLHELWALLNFLLPDIFADSQDFDDWFSSESSEEEKDKIVKQLHTVLQPFLLRRIKNEVETSLLPKQELNLYVGMSSMQKKWYRKILEKDLDAVNGANGNKESKTRLLNIVMQLRKCCNHPYLFDGAEPGPPYTTDEHLVFNSAKLLVLDKLLRRLKKEGSRVLIFSQMSRVLDILEDYCYLRDFNYCRIDGSTAHEDRIEAIDDYNAPDSDKFLFLLTTRAGGLGINLTSADIVVLFDSDWNPQADLQAMDRAHRIGQKKQVKVFRFVTDNSVEEKILERATQKLRLDQLVIQQNKPLTNKNKDKNNGKDALLSMIQHGAADVFETESNASSNGGTPAPGTLKADVSKEQEVNLDELLAKSETKMQSLNSKYESLGLDDLQKFNQESAYEWNGVDFKKKTQNNVIKPLWINPAKRERKENYSVDGYYKDVMNTGRSNTPTHTRMPRLHYFASHQFQSPQLRVLYEKDRMWMAKKSNYKAVLDDLKAVFGDSYNDKDSDDIKNQKLRLLQLTIDNAEPLTEEELNLKEQYEQEGFTNWNKVEFRKFVSLNGKYGRNSIESIASEMTATKTVEEVREYAAAFWSRIEEIDDYEKYLNIIETDEEKIEKLKVQQEALRRKMAQCENPMFELTLEHSPSKNYTEEEDRFILLMLFKYGLHREDLYDVIRQEIKNQPLFELDYSFKQKTAAELSRRGTTLLQCLEKEFNSKIVMDADLKERLDEEDKVGKRTREEMATARHLELEEERKKVKTE
ncbi:similar to Saccharomyces cerevisiae YBR245C ISW1 Member of the imitation-switch (ISWI) class of ATP-dependent chromatin remodeling complexes [Maudiozyma barnettii]|uniref:Similar to Saccharomyces cerevisiae YBR245C ISW1 Member of the imitation-switch (ISWI) class of ATP-dependent chromatin remodeling complexes n=1 Tax=Maudiozyma barnettii TaxID=61262 RepID=A0A8H2VJX5_9SACH|nr:chromatin-remodeling ATPase ISW1 [Kazachstania barnettii]CAB4256680.1 similar to Saccharomyces cerevisiae YBR245C ISW1 Member of the imitation-switch (ISWI) class of ATP-dependent chromatin remodeling complexes [Kazachstania barnettii]CAD1785336.1 similar to Saccharomyces cerevisiae YBR245C ISW1 Member of the imitation-switch (ISWI) class of ATP-dependent chromatin remodeling complexes [Kazachstania barnettii]